MARRPTKTSAGGRTDWDLGDLLRGDDDERVDVIKSEVERKSFAFIQKWKGSRDYVSDPLKLREALDEYELWRRTSGPDGDAGYYFWLRVQQDQNSPSLKAAANKIEEFGRRIENEMQFFHLTIAKMPPARQKRMLSHAALRKYSHFLERIFAESKYLLSEAEERVLNLKSAAAYSNWVKMTAGFLAKEERNVLCEDGTKRPKTLSEISSLMNSNKKKVRDAAALALNDVLADHVDSAEAEMNSILANKKVDDDLRGLPRPDLSRHISDDVGSDVVDALLDAVCARFGLSARFYELKARLMRVKKLAYHERNVEYGNVGGKYTYAAACSLVKKVLRGLDPEFDGIFQRFIDDGRIDVYPRKGKAGGAFCAYHLMSQPTYILLNHTDTLHDVLTLAHELGHGINDELIKKRQHALNFGTPVSTAEAASTFLEDFVLQEVLRRADDESRLAVMMMKLNDDVSTIFRQVACYRFEQDLHREFRQRGFVSKEEIGALFSRHMAAYMGPFVEQSKGSENWWVYWSHIRYFFYVYSYASGLLISKSLQHAVRAEPGFIANVKEFLSAGLSDSPQNIFGRLGIDITDGSFWHRGIDEVERLLEETWSLARRLKKI